MVAKELRSDQTIPGFTERDEMIETPAVKHAIKLIQCKSVTPDEGGALDYLEAALSKIGFTCTRLKFSDIGTPDVDNLYARIGVSAPHICFAGHTDVVPIGTETDWAYPPFEARIENGILYGRGTADMKGSIACFLAAVETYLSNLEG